MQRVRVTPIALGGLLVAVGVFLAWRGHTYYPLAWDDRPDHPDYLLLRPSGLLGNGLGYAGALLVFLNLLYLARRRQLFSFGSMQIWLDVHVFSGLLGAELAAFHSAFQLRTALSRLLAASLGIVVVTGMIGRLIHTLVGRAAAHRVLPAVAARLDELVDGMGDLVLAAANAFPPTVVPANASLFRCLAALPAWRREASARREAVRVVARNEAAAAVAAGANAAALGALVLEAEQEAATEVLVISRAALLRSWRSLHRLFAILMLLAVAVHAGVAWHYGYRWIFE